VRSTLEKKESRCTSRDGIGPRIQYFNRPRHRCLERARELTPEGREHLFEVRGTGAMSGSDLACQPVRPPLNAHVL
jgi:hypothetical protein